MEIWETPHPPLWPLPTLEMLQCDFASARQFLLLPTHVPEHASACLLARDCLQLPATAWPRCALLLPATAANCPLLPGPRALLPPPTGTNCLLLPCPDVHSFLRRAISPPAAANVRAAEARLLQVQGGG